MANEWYYTLNGEQQPAPASAAQLKQLATNGVLQPTDLVWQEGMANWAPASSVKGLFGARGAADPPSGTHPTADRPAADRAVAVVEKPVIARSSRAKPTRPAGAGKPGDPPDMHPLLVLVLTTVTCGLYGLWYAYQVCSTVAPGAEKDSAGKPRGQVRHPLGVMLLGYLTLGYYSYYGLYRLLRECVEYTGRTDIRPRTELSLMLIFPPYALFVALFRAPELIRAAAGQAGAPEPGIAQPGALLVNPLAFLALPLLVAAYQDALNRVWQKT
jgi:hypothetical protein